MLSLCSLLNTTVRVHTRMASNSVFVQTLNPISGKMEWQTQPEDYDYQQEVARAAFADMLHDSERNQLYYKGLEAAIKKKRLEGQKVHVLDIGTGTGLLSLMAARIGADTITAIEEFKPMAECALKIIKSNGYEEAIRLIRKRSTSVVVGPGQDMERRANILVTEVFDTELIGEGAISTFNHAHRHLLTDDCLVVPSYGTLYAQVVESDMAARWNRLHPVSVDGHRLEVADASTSAASLALHDLQLSQFDTHWFTPITKPLKVFKFDFARADGKDLPETEQTIVDTLAVNGGKCDAVFMWWDLHMDPDKTVLLSCAPKWAHPCPKSMAWRDHWMQAVYYPLRTPEVTKRQQLNIISNHDEYSLWFDISQDPKEAIGQVEMPRPTCGVHLALSRTRLGQINDTQRNEKYVGAMKKAIDRFHSEEKRWPNCFSANQLSLIPLMAGSLLKNSQVYLCEPNVQMKKVLHDLAILNGLEHKLVFLPHEDVSEALAEVVEDIDLVLAEPHFSASLLPWHNLYFWYCLNSVVTKAIIIMPIKAVLYAIPVHYQDLWKIRAPLHQVQGFDMKHFDDIIMHACDVSDLNVEPQPLWEYPCVCLGPACKLMTFDFTKSMGEDLVEETTISISDSSVLPNGMALWMEWQLDEETFVANGPKSDLIMGSKVDWDVHSKQGVHLFKSPWKPWSEIDAKVAFKTMSGELTFDFVPKLLL